MEDPKARILHATAPFTVKSCLRKIVMQCYETCRTRAEVPLKNRRRLPINPLNVVTGPPARRVK